ncbi:hypothetical protein AKJ53_00610 [candidate division MSBL1 archaeon SCGC-AAA382F02]|uniref:Diphthamide synthase domain-containing protein n=1 Tax=candidate division MSBL1 archaeon SCGC-AAA382F02 TaxID=1698282 RepID=A0A133VIV3_9EURY|nr:hypothetical protein AKJ53_00610 [candidate division MSBL1 archaeon SCGC-AAA382F02]
MELAALCSGGKDSSYALWLASKEGHEITKIVSMIPQRADSWMFHQPHSEVMELFAEASNIPLLKGETLGIKEKELEDLKNLLEGLSVDGVVSGALASNYQKTRIDKICEELDLISINPIWQKNPSKLLADMIKEEFEIIITSVSAEGFEKEWLGRKIDRECLEDLKSLKEKFGIHITGEGGEYETLVLDAPYFEKRIVPVETDRVWKGDRGYLKIKEFELE